MNITNIKITRFPTIVGDNGKTITVGDMIDEIIHPTESNINKIKLISKAKKDNNTELKDRLKKKLNHYSPMGLYLDGKRDTKHFINDSYSYIIPIDVDNIPTENMSIIYEKLKSIPSVFFVIKSASGKGYKGLMKIKDGLYNPKDHYKVGKDVIYPLINQHLNFKVDDRQSQFTQPFYYTTSSQYYYVEDVDEYDTEIIFPIKDDYDKPTLKDDEKDMNFDFIPDILFEHYNISVLSACSVANDKQVYYDKYLEIYVPNNERGSLIRHLETFEKFVIFVNSLTYDYVYNFIPNDVLKLNMDNNKLPNISKFVFDNIPPLLKELTDKYDDKFDKDIILLSQLNIFSGLFDRVSTVYVNNIIYPNLFTLIIGKAGVGKGVMGHSIKTITQKIKKEKNENTRKFNEFMVDVEYNKSNSKKKDFVKKELIKPIYHRTKLAPDSSFSAMFEQINSNKGLGIIFDTEMDTIGKNKKTDWGDLSILLRKGFQNEDHYVQRNNTNITIDNIKTSLLLSGTDHQLLDYFDSKNDGNLSRHMFYYVDKKFKIRKNLFGGFNYNTFLNIDYSNKIERLLEMIKDLDINITFTQEQDDRYSKFLDGLSSKLLLLDDELSGTLVRFGTMGTKIMMILTILRLYNEDGNTIDLFNEDQPVLDVDLEIVIDLIRDTLVKHTYAVINSFTIIEQHVEIKSYSVVDVFEDMKNEFTRKEFIEIYEKKLNLGVKSADRTISKLKSNKKIVKVKNGYKKM